jgi:hypothetical protein
MLSKEIYDKVSADWERLGLPGDVPNVRHFEKDV